MNVKKLKANSLSKMYWVVFTVALGGVLGRDGESCVPANCWGDVNSCHKSVKVSHLLLELLIFEYF